MRLLGLVTARGGSKGFPGKNLAPLAGRPLVAWAHRLLDQVRQHRPDLLLVLSTDDPAIAAAWPPQDRPTHLRPAHLATDSASSFDVVIFELDRLAAEGQPCDAVLLVQPTSPLLAPGDLLAALAMFDHGHRSVIGVTASPHPVQWSLFRGGGGTLTWAMPAPSDARRQDLPPSFIPCGFYVASTAFLREKRAFIVPGVTRGVIVPAARAVDIDHAIDLDIAACHLRRSHGERAFELGGKRIGAGSPAFVIAEAGVNHNGDVNLAHKLVEAAAAAGADAVKFQTFKASELVTQTARKAAYREANTAAGESQYEMLARLELPAADFAALKARAESLGLVFLSSPFDPASAKLLDDLGVCAFKLGSGELTNTPLLAQLAALGRPLILSTGMATLDEVEDAARVIEAAAVAAGGSDSGGPGGSPVAWLHCVSSYPAPPEHSNLRAMDSLRLVVAGPIGMSDHTLGWEISLAAVARGAAVIEKHLTLSRAMLGPDHAASLEPGEMKQMIQEIRRIESALGDGVKRPMPSELDTLAVARKSLVAARDLPAGTVLQKSDLAVKRPGTGMSPAMLSRVVGLKLTRALAVDHALTEDHLR